MIEDICNGEPCVVCAWCEKCERVVGTPHLDVCMCSDDSKHALCSEHEVGA